MIQSLWGYCLLFMTCVGSIKAENPFFDILRPRDLERQEAHRLNLMTDICWKCIFPIHVMGKNRTSEHADFVTYEPKTWCSCKGWHIGTPLSFWEPMLCIEVTQTPYKSPFFGGMDLSNADNLRGRGGVAHVGESGRSSFYHVHYIPLPLIRILALLPGFTCLEKMSDALISLPTELDPTWNHPALARIFSLEMYAFTKPAAQAACIEDCRAAQRRKPDNRYFWCAGCLGSYYPFVGHVAHHVDGIQASSLVMMRALGKLHFLRSKLKLGTGFEAGDYCGQTIFAHLPKSHYKTQMIYPVPDFGSENKKCHPLGEGTSTWGSSKTYPGGGEDFIYLVWTKMHCCFDWVDVASSLIPGAKPVVQVIDSLVDSDAIKKITEILEQAKRAGETE